MANNRTTIRASLSPNLKQSPQSISEQVYCQHGEMENRIKGAPGDRQGVSGASPLH